MTKEPLQQVKSIEEMNTNRNVMMLSFPIFIELILQLLVGNIDQIMVSRISQSSVAAIVNANQVISLIILILSMISAAVMVVLSRYLGANDKKGVVELCTTSFFSIIVASIVTTIIIIVFKNAIFSFMNVPDDIRHETSLYLTIVTLASVAQGFYFVYSAILRAFTFMKEVMNVSIVMNILNIIGNAILINGLFGLPQMGVVGAAVSTVISKIFGVFMIRYYCKERVDLQMHISYTKPVVWIHLKKILQIAIPSGTESLSYQVSQLCILSIINRFGTVVIATKGYCSIFANISYLYVIALGEATQIVLGYLIGGKRFDLLKKRVTSTTWLSIIVAVTVSTFLFLGSNWVFLIFTNDPEVISLGKKILLIEIGLEIGRAINIIMTRSLVAVGDVVTPTVVGIVFQWLVALLGAYFFGVYLNMGLVGVWIAMALDECIRGLIFMIHFYKERWKKYWKQ